MDSVRRDLEWLLNSRTSHPAHLWDTQDLTVSGYGIPDFGSYSPECEKDRALLVRRIRRSITVFEPRLQNIRVTVEPQMVDEKTIQVNIEAVLVVESIREPVWFQTILESRTSRWEVYEQT